LGVRVLEKFKTFEQSILKYKNPNYSPPTLRTISFAHCNEANDNQQAVNSNTVDKMHNGRMPRKKTRPIKNSHFIEPKYKSMELHDTYDKPFQINNVFRKSRNSKTISTSPFKARRRIAPTTRPLTASPYSRRKSRRPLPNHRSIYVVNQNLIARQKYINDMMI
jgi:hypothetical protein